MQYSSITYEGEGASRVAILRDLQNNTEARVAVGMGFNVFSFKVSTPTGMADVLYAEEGFPKAGMRATSSGTPILVPFPNRIAGGKFIYDGKDYSLPLNSQGVNAIHGFAFDKPWRIVNQSPPELPPSITGEFEMLRDSEFTEEHWPGNFQVRCEVRTGARQIDHVFSISNLSNASIPFGLGTHPYFRLIGDGTGSLNRCGIIVAAETLVELKDTIPTGNVRPVDDETRLVIQDRRPGRIPVHIGDRKLDDVYTGLQPFGKDGKSPKFEHAVFDLRKDETLFTAIIHNADFPYVVVYVPSHRKAVCIEPYSCVTNAVNLGERLGQNGPPTGLWRLEPDEERKVIITTSVTVTDPHPEDAE
jgi:aldose 1-epimerase